MATTARLILGARRLATALPITVRRSTGCSLRLPGSLYYGGNPIMSRHMTMAAAATKPLEASKLHTVDVPEDDPEVIPFSTLKGKIAYDTLKAITVKPFKLEAMTPVQSAVLGLLPELVRPYDELRPQEGEEQLPPRDLLVKARTGTGKTLAFLVPAVEARLNAITRAGKEAVIQSGKTVDKSLEGRAKRAFAKTHVGTLIISPTRELATQIANEAMRLTTHHDDFDVILFTGGASKRMQLRDFNRKRRDIVVTTPGRLLDMLASEPDVREGIEKTETLILDEADTLLDMGFRDDIEAIIKYLPKSPVRQTFMFSATVSDAIRQVARKVLDPEHEFINTVGENDIPVHERIPQYHTVLPSASQQIPYTLQLIAHDQLTNPGKSKIILFLPTTKMTQLYATLLRELSATTLPSLKKTRIYEIHSKKSQESRTKASDAFRGDKTGSTILVTSDVSARGVDYPGVTRVIQLGIPGGPEQYIHRVGRTGRAGTSGRGDLVLLPWETGFVTWQLNDIPLKPVTVNELKSQLRTLAQKYDENPSLAFWGPDGPPNFQDARKFPKSMRRPTAVPQEYPSNTESIVESIESSVNSLLPSLDEAAIRETFAAMLGYYIGKTAELRLSKNSILEGCRQWAVEACGLPKPPYVSDAFLQRLGIMREERSRHFRDTIPSRDDRHRAMGQHWMGRGQVSSRSYDGDRRQSFRRMNYDDDDSRGSFVKKLRYESRSDDEGVDSFRRPRRELGQRRDYGSDRDERRPRRDYGEERGERPRRDYGEDRPRRDYSRERGEYKRSGFSKRDED